LSFSNRKSHRSWWNSENTKIWHLLCHSISMEDSGWREQPLLGFVPQTVRTSITLRTAQNHLFRFIPCSQPVWRHVTRRICSNSHTCLFSRNGTLMFIILQQKITKQLDAWLKKNIC
jgi:hypothetical protein